MREADASMKQRRTVLISGGLLASMFEHDSVHRGYRVVSGLPCGARLISVGMTAYGEAALVFEGEFAADAPEPFTPLFRVAESDDVAQAEARANELIAAMVGQ